MPNSMAQPISDTPISNPVMAFEFSRTPAHLTAVFGELADPLRTERAKFLLLGVAFGFATCVLVPMRGWLSAVLCALASVALFLGLCGPLHWGEAAVSTIALGWIGMLTWATWRVWRDRGA